MGAAILRTITALPLSEGRSAPSTLGGSFCTGTRQQGVTRLPSPPFFPGRGDVSPQVRGQGTAMAPTAGSFPSLSIFGNQALILYPWSFTGPDSLVGRAVGIKRYLFLGGQV